MSDSFSFPPTEPSDLYYSLELNSFNNFTRNENSSINGNETSSDFESEPPKEFSEISSNARNCVIVYFFLFIISATGNLTVFTSVFQQMRKSKSRILPLILHLSIADLLVTFCVIPLEIIWRLTVQWYGGNLLCKICQFFRAFGLYLSSNVLMCISLDRFMAIVYPLRTSQGANRGRIMLIGAWIFSAVCSVPQCFVFHVMTHPKYKSFKQCVAIGFFRSEEEERWYSIFSVFALYFLPLVVIVFTYGMILWKISRKARQHKESTKSVGETSGKILLRRNEAHTQVMERAKSKTLKLSIVIFIVFVLCWSPYVTMTLWYMFDRESAKQVNSSLQDGLFLMAVANSCLNPLVYGSYTRECRESFPRCLYGRARRNDFVEQRRQLSRNATVTCGLDSTYQTINVKLGSSAFNAPRIERVIPFILERADVNMGHNCGDSQANNIELNEMKIVKKNGAIETLQEIEVNNLNKNSIVEVEINESLN